MQDDRTLPLKVLGRRIATVVPDAELPRELALRGAPSVLVALVCGAFGPMLTRSPDVGEALLYGRHFEPDVPWLDAAWSQPLVLIAGDAEDFTTLDRVLGQPAIRHWQHRDGYDRLPDAVDPARWAERVVVRDVPYEAWQRWIDEAGQAIDAASRARIEVGLNTRRSRPSVRPR